MAILAAVITTTVQAVETIAPDHERNPETVLTGTLRHHRFPLLGRAPHRDAVHAQRRLADANWHALAVLAAGADAGVELEIVADHADAAQIGGTVADQHGA